MKKSILVVSVLSILMVNPLYASYICETNNKSLNADINKMIADDSSGVCETLGLNKEIKESEYVKRYTLSNPNSPGCDLSVVMPGMPDMGGFLGGNLQIGIDLCSAMQKGLDFFSDEANKAVGGMFNEVESAVQDALNQFAADYADAMPSLVEETFKLESNTTLEFTLSEGETISTALLDHLTDESAGTQAESAVNSAYYEYEKDSGIDVTQSGDWSGPKGVTNTEPVPADYVAKNMPSDNKDHAIPTFNSSGLEEDK